MAYADQLSGAQIAAHAAYSQATAGNLVAEAVINGAALVRNWLSARKAKRELGLLSNHLLRDIGLKAEDVRPLRHEEIFGMRPQI